MSQGQNIPIDVVGLLPVLDKKLIELLKSLSAGEWQMQTTAKLWKVKDVAAHLLDGNIRLLSIYRDGYFGEQANVQSYDGLVSFLNSLNADWVKAMKRISPEMLIHLHEVTGNQYCAYYASLDPFAKSIFAVNWAGEKESKNWMHIAREYTEKWLHQQQIRDAVNKPGLITRELYYPFIDTFMMALPHTYREVNAEVGTTIKMTIIGEVGGSWFITRVDSIWELSKVVHENPTTEIMIDPDTAWKLFSKSIRPEAVRDKVKISGNQKLGEVGLSMVSVMA